MRDFSRNKVVGEFNAINLSDIHFLHRQTPTKNLLQQCSELILGEDPSRLDAITMSGDVFDRISQFITDDVIAFRHWGTWLLGYCKQHNIYLVLLEGTRSHDGGQSKWFVEQNMTTEIHANVLYYDTLCIKDEPFGLKVLYLPDNYSHDPNITFNDVVSLINEQGDPDLILMHGGFDYQLPELAKRDHCVHDSEAYNALVRKQQGWIISGHIHIASEKDRIKVGGSVGRLAHNEEGPKGMLRYTLRETFMDDWTFVENKHADTYLTIRAYDLDRDSLSALLANKVATLRKDSHIQIKCKKTDEAAQSFKSIVALYPSFIWSLNPDKESSKRIMENSFLNNVIAKGGDLTAANTMRLLLDRIKVKRPEMNHVELGRWLERLSQEVNR